MAATSAPGGISVAGGAKFINATSGPILWAEWGQRYLEV